MADTVEFAKAKVNLTLHITGQRDDGLHELDSLVVFPDLGDKLRISLAQETLLSIDGPFEKGLSRVDNLALDAADLMRVPVIIQLTKNLPIASGIGGGSADAAAVFRAIQNICNAELPAFGKITRLGADIPVCIDQAPSYMRGIGEKLTPLRKLPPFALVLANPLKPVTTGAVFNALPNKLNTAMPDQMDFPDFISLITFLRACRNDLQDPALSICPDIGEVLNALETSENCALARMSGSGATCFGVFESEEPAHIAAAQISRNNPNWWVESAGVQGV